MSHWQVRKTNVKNRERGSKCLCLGSELRSWMLVWRRDTQSLQEGREARLDSQSPLSLQLLLQALCMQRWQPKIIIVCTEGGIKVLYWLYFVSEGSLKPPETRQGVTFRNNPQESCFLSPLTLELSCHWFAVTSAAIRAQTLLKPSNISP